MNKSSALLLISLALIVGLFAVGVIILQQSPTTPTADQAIQGMEAAAQGIGDAASSLNPDSPIVEKFPNAEPALESPVLETFPDSAESAEAIPSSDSLPQQPIISPWETLENSVADELSKMPANNLFLAMTGHGKGLTETIHHPKIPDGYKNSTITLDWESGKSCVINMTLNFRFGEESHQVKKDFNKNRPCNIMDFINTGNSLIEKMLSEIDEVFNDPVAAKMFFQDMMPKLVEKVANWANPPAVLP